MAENILLIRNILYRCFFIGVAGYILSILVWLGFHNGLVSLSVRFYGIGKQDLPLLMLYFFSLMKLLLLFLFLIPALALHWTGKVIKNQNK